MEFYENYICNKCGNQVENVDGNYKFCPYCGENLSLNKNKKNMKEEGPVLDEEIERLVYDWLGRKLDIDTWLVSETVRNQMATVFLLIWPILEKEIFQNDMKKYHITSVANQYKDSIDESAMDEMFNHFHQRFQDPHKYNELKNRDQWDKIDKILQLPSSRVFKENKIIFLIYVVYRYRNNIFHGIKSINQWNDFAYEIHLCIKFMVLLGNGIVTKE